MASRWFLVLQGLLLFILCLVYQKDSTGQERTAEPPLADSPEVPKGVEVLARGPVHEAFATPVSEAKATPTIPKKPPAPVEEMPPDEKPDGDVVWIGGYWHWDDDRNDYLWVSGCWRVQPEGKDWVPGYWREVGEQWQWVPGFWANARSESQNGEITYYPEPPAPLQVAPPGDPPGVDVFYVPGNWVWVGGRYSWRAGYWGRVRPGYVYVPAHYRWTPYGYVFIPGYWDLVVSRRGLLYAPVAVDVVVVGPRFVFAPRFAVYDTLVLDAFFIRPACCHYYFGDYYGPRYRTLGFETVVVYSRRSYDPILAYRRWEYRDNPRWLDAQVNLAFARDHGRAPVPPRTLVQQNTVIQRNVTNVTNVTNINNNVTNVKNVTKNTGNKATSGLASTREVLAAQGARAVKVDDQTRIQARQAAQAVQQASSQQRKKTETQAVPGQKLTQPKTASLNVPSSSPSRPRQGGSPNIQGKTVGNSRPPAGAPARPTSGPGKGPAPSPDLKGSPAKNLQPSAPPAGNPGKSSSSPPNPKGPPLKGPASTSPNPKGPTLKGPSSGPGNSAGGIPQQPPSNPPALNRPANPPGNSPGPKGGSPRPSPERKKKR